MKSRKSRKIRTMVLLSLPVFFLMIVLAAITYTNIAHRLNPASQLTPLEMARQDVENKNYYKAVDMYQQIITQDPGNIDAVLDLSAYYLERSDLTSSTELLLKYSDGNDHRVLSALAADYYQQGKTAEATTAAQKALSQDKNDAQALLLLLKLYNLAVAKQELSDLVEATPADFPDQQVQLYLLISRINLGQDSIAGLQKLGGSVSGPLFKMINDYATYFADLSDPAKEFTAKANLVYDLISNSYPELAMPFAQDLVSLNKYYENSYLYRAMIYLHANNYAAARDDLAQLEKYFPGRLNDQILQLEVALDQKDATSVAALDTRFATDFKTQDSDKYFEIFKLLYKYHQYGQFFSLYLQVGAQLSSYQTEVNFLAMKTMVYLNNYQFLPPLITYFNSRLNILNQEQHATFTAVQALQYFNDQNIANAQQLLQQADTLYFYSPFVQYIKSIVFNDPNLLAKAYEFDLQNEIPAK